MADRVAEPSTVPERRGLVKVIGCGFPGDRDRLLGIRLRPRSVPVTGLVGVDDAVARRGEGHDAWPDRGGH